MSAVGVPDMYHGNTCKTFEKYRLSLIREVHNGIPINPAGIHTAFLMGADIRRPTIVSTVSEYGQ